MAKTNAENQVETADELQRQIVDLQKKHDEALLVEEEEHGEQVEFPLATVRLIVGLKCEIQKKEVSPPELAILVALHSKSAGGSPITDIKPTGTRKIDQLALWSGLINRYGKLSVETLFPSPNSPMPTRFSRAMKIGGMTSVAPPTMMEFKMI